MKKKIDNLQTGETAVIAPQELPGAQQASAAPEQKALRALVARRHPKYEDLLPHWNFMAATYHGGREWFKDNIFRYIKEGDTEFKDRVDRAYRFNHTREVVDLINKYLFKQSIVRNGADAPEPVKKFWKKATKNGLSIKDLARQISKKTSQYGRVGVVVDMTRPSTAVVSRADEQAAGLHAYAYIVGPQQLLDYSYDQEGILNWVLIHEVGRDDADPLNSSGEPILRYRLWTRNDWTLYKEVRTGKGKQTEIVIEEQGEHGLGEVPVILADNILSDDDYESPALIDDIAYLDRATANYLSNLDAIIQDQTFSQLAMPAQGVLPGEDNYTKLVEMGTKRVFLFDGEAGQVPFYLSPDVKQAQLIVTAINKIISEIYHTVGLAGERTKQDNAVGIDNSSGVAKAYDFERVNALLAAKADSLESVENKIAELVAKWHGVTIAEDTAPLVSYPDNFDTRGLYDEFDIAARLMLIEAPDQVRRAQMESVIDKLFPQLAKDLKKKMLAELQSWPVDPIELSSRITDKNNAGDLTNTTSITSKTGEDDTENKAKNPDGNHKAKAFRNNRQGEVTKDTE